LKIHNLEGLSVLLDSNTTLLRPLPHLLVGDFNAYVDTHQESPRALPDSNDLDYPHHRDGDLQPHHQTTTHPSNLSTSRGRYLLNLCDTHDLLLLNGRYPRSPTPLYTCQRTLVSTSTNTIIDYVILTRTHVPMVLSCTVLIEPLLTFSDHNPIFLRLQSAPMSHTPAVTAPRVPIRTLYNEHKLSTPALVQKLQDSCTQSLPGIFPTFTRLDHQYITKQIL